MRRVFWAPVLCLVFLALLLATPAVAQDGDDRFDGRVLVSVNGDMTLPAGDEAEVVVVVDGDARIEGSATVVTVVNGTATLAGGTVGTLAVVNGSAQIGAGSTVTGDVLELRSTVTVDPGATVGGDVRSMTGDLVGVGIAVGVLGLLAWIAFTIVAWAAGLALAAFGARQVRRAEWLISREPVRTFGAGLAMLFLPPIIAVLLIVTVVLLPVGVVLLLFVWPALMFLGWLVASIWIGEWILRTSGRPAPERRPYLGVTIGLIVATILSIVPLAGALIALFGMGAVTLAGWRMLRQGEADVPPAAGYVPVGG
jgi:cytoskeletal protein CcmA (bactofilin family)